MEWIILLVVIALWFLAVFTFGLIYLFRKLGTKWSTVLIASFTGTIVVWLFAVTPSREGAFRNVTRIPLPSDATSFHWDRATTTNSETTTG